MSPNDPPRDWADLAEDRVLDRALRLVSSLSWGRGLIEASAREAGLSAAETHLLLPRGASDLAALLFLRHDQMALATLAGEDGAGLKVRERIQTAVLARVQAAMVDEPAVRRASAYLAQPAHVGLAISLGWASADKLWRWAGDTATDENHYSKRAILGAVLASTMAVRLSKGEGAALAHLKSSIDCVMAFERWKAQRVRPTDFFDRAAGVLGRLRYGTP